MSDEEKAMANTLQDIKKRVSSLAAWLLGRTDAPTDPHDPLTDLEEVDYIGEEEGRAIFDRVARQHLDITGDEFLRRWDAGEYSDSEDPAITTVAMLRPLGR